MECCKEDQVEHQALQLILVKELNTHLLLWQTEQFIEVNGLMEKEMVTEFRIGQIIAGTKATGQMTWQTEKENFSTLMEIFIVETG